MLPTEHLATVVPAGCLPGCVLISFQGRGLPVTMTDGHSGHLGQTGCTTGELPGFLKALEAQYGVKILLKNDHDVTLKAGAL
jgi:hypothetical protein